MERLTHRYTDGEAWASIYKASAYGENECKGPIIDRLAAYEDTGMEPEAVEAMKTAMMGKSIAEIKEFEGIPIDHLRELVEVERAGRLVVLPCKAGDTVYKIFCDKIILAVIEKVEINAFTNPRIWVQVGTEFMSSQCYRFDLSCGRDFYLTREEAEAALAQRAEAAHHG